MIYVHRLVATGTVVSLSEYRDLAAVNRQDLVLWREAEAQRVADEIELAKKAGERQS